VVFPAQAADFNMSPLAITYNPLDEPIQRRIRLPLYRAGFTNRAVIHWKDERSETLMLARDCPMEVAANVPACAASGGR
jgi:hypothetical protein